MNFISDLAEYFNEKAWSFITKSFLRENCFPAGLTEGKQVQIAEKLFPQYKEAGSPKCLSSFFKYVQAILQETQGTFAHQL